MLKVAALALLATYALFFEYLPPFQQVEIPYDLAGYHYPLADYAFQAVRHGRLPQWDPTIYCGMGFAGNTQAALFYPPTWLLFLANWGRPHLSFLSLEIFVFLHAWLAFCLCYLWLRHRLDSLPALLGACAFAYGGYLLNELQHLGGVAAYAWFPLALLGIDQSVEQDRWRPLLKTAAASALCFLAGYPPTWVAFAVSVITYALVRHRGWIHGARASAAIAFSMLLAMVQLAPALEMNTLKMPEVRYGGGYHDPAYYLSFFIPNYWDFGLRTAPQTHEGFEYLYLGAPVFLGLLMLLRHRSGPGYAALLAVLAAALLVVVNPFNLVSGILSVFFLGSEIIRDHYFLAAVFTALAALAAVGLDRFLKSPGRTLPPLAGWTVCGAMFLWTLRQLASWWPDGLGLATGWPSGVEALITTALFAAGLFALRGQSGRYAAVLSAALLLFAAADYKINGTSKRFNATRTFTRWAEPEMPEVARITYLTMRTRPDHRVAMDRTGPYPQFLRQYGLSTPQGFDPFITNQYRKAIDPLVKFRTNWEFDLDPGDKATLQFFGIRYFVTSREGPLFARLSADPDFHLMEPSLHYKVFEYRDSRPPYGFENSSGAGDERVAWRPEYREFRVRAKPGGDQFHLVEQWAPGWTAAVDGRKAEVRRWRGAFLAVPVPEGDHVVILSYVSQGVLWGAAVSVLALAALMWSYTKTSI